MASATLILLVVLGGIFIAVRPGGKSAPPAVAGSTPPASSLATSNGASSPAPVATATPTAAPADVQWQLLGQVALPYSASAGPRTVTATTAAGFAHTPTGALIAAKQLSSRAGLSAGKDVYEPTLTRQFVPSTDRDTLLGLLRAAPQQPAAPGELSQLAGFRFVAYTPDAAVVELVDRAPGAGAHYFISTLSLLWRDGDWMMQAPPGGSWAAASHETTDLLGVVEWGAR